MMIDGKILMTFAFSAFNIARIAANIGEIKKFAKATNNLDTHSIAMYLSWALGNGFISGQFYLNEKSINETVTLSMLSAVFLAAMSIQIFFKRVKYKHVSEMAIRHEVRNL